MPNFFATFRLLQGHRVLIASLSHLRTSIHANIIEEDSFMRFQVIPGTGGEVKFRFWFSISITIIYHMLRIGTISPHSQSAAITEIIEECQKVGWNGALGPSQELSL